MVTQLEPLPLGRPGMFEDPVTVGPVTAERKLKEALVKLARLEGVSTSEIIRRALLIGAKDIARQRKERRS